MTKSTLPAGCVVVGTDGSEQATHAVEWAAREAALEDRTLAIVHTTDQNSIRGSSWQNAAGLDHHALTEALNAAGHQVLTIAANRARAVAPGVSVRTELLALDPRAALVDLSATAHLLVLGSRGRGPLKTALLGSVSASVAKHAECPVVVCRPTDPQARSGDAGVIVGVDGSPASRPVLEFAFAHAVMRGLPLTVMHCFWDVATATTGSAVVAQDEGGLSDLQRMLAESVAGMSEKYPDVRVTRELARGLVDECLADAAPAAELLVVGRPRRHGLSSFLHSSCALAVLERAHTTVAVVPEVTADDPSRQ